jgi:hypothetical protein
MFTSGCLLMSVGSTSVNCVENESFLVAYEDKPRSSPKKHVPKR